VNTRSNIRIDHRTYDVIYSRVHLAIQSSEQDDNGFYCFFDKKREREDKGFSKELCKICELAIRTSENVIIDDK